MKPETKKVLITAKTYPTPSKTYGETVCCAGVDIDKRCWIRLYPIPFRDLDQSKKFKKYNIIKVQCNKATDHRIESYKVNCDSIEIIDHLDTKKDKWARRKQIVLPLASTSFCDIFQDIQHNKSLGMFKPLDIDFHWTKATLENEQKRRACYAQLSFFDKRKDTIEQIPFNFYYSFRCADSPDCPGHKLLIIDWELGKSYRDWRYRYKNRDILLGKIRERWLNRMCAEKNDIYFYVGNMMRFRDQFMVLGVFYPQK